MSRYLKAYWRYSTWVHAITGSLILVITLTLGILAIVKIGVNGIVNKPHTIIGFIVMILVTFSAVGGFISRGLLVTLKWRTNFALMVSQAHKVS
jgi:hypothetical protein